MFAMPIHCVQNAFRICLNKLKREKRHVALKIVKSARHYTETAIDEIKILKSVYFLQHKLDFIQVFTIY